MNYTDETGYTWESEGAAHFHSLLVRGVEWLERPRIRPQTAQEASCAYCASIITGNRCESCGAPKRAEKPKAQEWPMLLHDSGPAREGDGWRRTRITACPPKTP